MKTKLLYVLFRNELHVSEIELFRGAILNQMPSSIVLFHNHIGEKFRYSYPLIQYKRLKNRAFIVCISDGVEAIGNLFSLSDFHFRLGERELKMEISSIRTQDFLIQIWHENFIYKLNRWLALNEKNYKEYQALEGVGERIAFLEKKLVGNILSFAKGIGFYIEQEITCKILDISFSSWSLYKGVRMKTFSVVFKTNLSLPEYIGLGKGVSIGYGTLFRVKK